MSEENLKLWESVEKTDAKFTKKFTRGGGFKGDAINPCYITKRLTETFGPCGPGWQFVLEHEEYVDGHTLPNGDKAICHVVRGHLDYFIDGVRCSTGPQFGQTMFVSSNSNGVFTDEEAPKKSVTDCLGKCAVLLGFNSDIYLGKWDSNKYVNQPAAQPAAKAKPAAGVEVESGAKAAAGPVLLPENCSKWFPEQWQEYCNQNAPTVPELQRIFSQACGLSAFYLDTVKFRDFCKVVNDHLKEIAGQTKSTERTALVEALKGEARRLKN